MLKLALMGMLFCNVAVQAEEVTLQISNMGGVTGQLAFAVFNNPDSFPDQSANAILTKYSPLPVSLNETSVTINLRPGRYALATFLDHNKNQKLDTNIAGAPKERFGFSQNPRITFSAPNFAECAFEVEANKKQVLPIRLKKLL